MIAAKRARAELVRRAAFLARYAHQPFDVIVGHRPSTVELAIFEAEIGKLLDQCPPLKL